MNNDGLVRVFLWIVLPSISICVWMPLPDKMKLDDLLFKDDFNRRKPLKNDDANRRRCHDSFSGGKTYENMFPFRYRKQSEYAAQLKAIDGAKMASDRIRHDFGSYPVRRDQQRHLKGDFSKIFDSHVCKRLSSTNGNVSNTMPTDIQQLCDCGKIYPEMKTSRRLVNDTFDTNEAKYVSDGINVFAEMNRMDTNASLVNSKKDISRNSSCSVVEPSDTPTNYGEDVGTLQGILPLLKANANIAFSKYAHLPVMKIHDGVGVSGRTRPTGYMVSTDRNFEIESNIIKSANLVGSSDDNNKRLNVVYHSTKRSSEDIANSSVTPNRKGSIDNRSVNQNFISSEDYAFLARMSEFAKRLSTSSLYEVSTVETSKSDGSVTDKNPPSLDSPEKVSSELTNKDSSPNNALNALGANVYVSGTTLANVSANLEASRIGEPDEPPTESIIQVNSSVTTKATTSFDEYLNIMKIPEIIEKLCDKLDQKFNNTDPFEINNKFSSFENSSTTKATTSINVHSIINSI